MPFILVMEALRRMMDKAILGRHMNGFKAAVSGVSDMVVLIYFL